MERERRQANAILDKRGYKCYHMPWLLGVAQLGSVLEWGSRGREFKSHHPDQRKALFLELFSCFGSTVEMLTRV